MQWAGGSIAHLKAIAENSAQCCFSDRKTACIAICGEIKVILQTLSQSFEI
jgi:hypothetical protein